MQPPPSENHQTLLKALQELVGLKLVHVADRSLSVMIFDKESTDAEGDRDDHLRPYLSLNCQWRLLNEDQTICLSSLQRDPCEKKTRSSVTHQAFRDLLAQGGFRVTKVEVGSSYDLRLVFENGYELQAFAFDPGASFHWAIKDIPGYGTIYVEGSRPEATR